MEKEKNGQSQPKVKRLHRTKHFARVREEWPIKRPRPREARHRASNNNEPRSIYGKIVSTADRNTSVGTCFERTYSYDRKFYPDYTDEQQFERAYNHLQEKFGENGYAKFYLEDEEYESFLKEMRTLLSNKASFIKAQSEYIAKQKLAGVKF